ncbi:MAG: aminotransferase class I/II-fold pyridoxal phosphate-dependent enzyme [Gammaproteobacteria bacterium]|nr:aminotransferase class I/II-fold pyridoxal phosphate-dependent enzyme [Gammaproteobacteria bacterium]
MSLEKIQPQLTKHIEQLKSQGISKGEEKIVIGKQAAKDGFSERYFLQGYQERAFLRMNSNSYLGFADHVKIIQAEANAAEQFGTGPGAVRFISGTYKNHIELEKRLAEFHQREACMIMSSAYATVMGVLPQFINENTLVISDALNHNCIINAIRLSGAGNKAIYPHLDLQELNEFLESNIGKVKRVCIVSDGIFSMRGDHAPMQEIKSICLEYEEHYEEGVILIVDDSHGVGAFGKTGRGTEEFTNTQADILIATLGKAFGVNGGYIVSNKTVIDYLKETVPFYIYSNPITPAEAAATLQAVNILDSSEGEKLLSKLRHLTAKLRSGLVKLGFETIEGEHPVVPILIRDTDKTSKLVEHLFNNNILATGLNYPVVPKGEEEIRLQVAANQTDQDIEYILKILNKF